MDKDQPRRPGTNGRAWHRGWWVFFGGLLGAIVGAALFWLIFPGPGEMGRDDQPPDPFGVLAAFHVWFYLMCFAMYGLAPGILVGGTGGFLAWWRARRGR